MQINSIFETRLLLSNSILLVCDGGFLLKVLVHVQDQNYTITNITEMRWWCFYIFIPLCYNKYILIPQNIYYYELLLFLDCWWWAYWNSSWILALWLSYHQSAEDGVTFSIKTFIIRLLLLLLLDSCLGYSWRKCTASFFMHPYKVTLHLQFVQQSVALILPKYLTHVLTVSVQ